MLTTCVGLQYGHLYINAREAFLNSVGFVTLTSYTLHLKSNMADLPTTSFYMLIR